MTLFAIVHAWENPAARMWLREFAAALRHAGHEVVLDRWDGVAGVLPNPASLDALNNAATVVWACTPELQRRVRGGGYVLDEAASKARLGVEALQCGDWTYSAWSTSDKWPRVDVRTVSASVAAERVLDRLFGKNVPDVSQAALERVRCDATDFPSLLSELAASLQISLPLGLGLEARTERVLGALVQTGRAIVVRSKATQRALSRAGYDELTVILDRTGANSGAKLAAVAGMILHQVFAFVRQRWSRVVTGPRRRSAQEHALLEAIAVSRRHAESLLRAGNPTARQWGQQYLEQILSFYGADHPATNEARSFTARWRPPRSVRSRGAAETPAAGILRRLLSPRLMCRGAPWCSCSPPCVDTCGGPLAPHASQEEG